MFVCVCPCVINLKKKQNKKKKLELLDYLQDPELVARFQRRCGLFLVESARCNGGTTHAPTGTASPSSKPRGHPEGKQEQQENNSKFQSDATRRAAIVSVVKIQKVHTK